MTQIQKYIFYADAARLQRLADAVGARPSGRWTVKVQWMLELKPQRFEAGTQRLVSDDDDVGQRLMATHKLAHRLNKTVARSGLKDFAKEFVTAKLVTQTAVEEAYEKTKPYGYKQWKLIAPVYAYCAWDLDDATKLDLPHHPGEPV